MLRNILTVSTLVVLFSCQPSSTKTTGSDVFPKQESDWIDLLEGNNLEQWEMYSQGELAGWQISNGELHSSGAGWDANEDIITRQSFANFELDLEWKIAAENSSGIFFYVQKGKDQPIYEAAPEYQVMDDKGWPEQMNPDQYTSASYAMYAGEGAVVKPVGEWNSTKIVVRYPNVQHWLNGVKTVEYSFGSEDWKVKKAAGKWADISDYGIDKSGSIGLQNAGKVVYRNIKVKELR